MILFVAANVLFRRIKELSLMNSPMCCKLLWTEFCICMCHVLCCCSVYSCFFVHLMSVGTFETEHSVAVNHGNKSLFVIREANPVYNFHSHGRKPHPRGYPGAEQTLVKRYTWLQMAPGVWSVVQAEVKIPGWLYVAWCLRDGFLICDVCATTVLVVSMSL